MKLLGLIIKHVFIFFSAVMLLAMVAFRVAEPDFQDVDVNALPDSFPLLLSWQDERGRHYCQAFFVHDLDTVARAVGEYMFSVADPAACEAAINYFRENTRWPVMIDGATQVYWPYISYSVSANGAGRQAVMLSYSVDDDVMNVSEYTASDNTIVAARHKLYSGPAVALQALAVSMLAVMAFYLAYFINRYFRKRN